MAFREVTVIEVREVLRLWLRGDMGLRRIADAVGCDRKTVRRYVEAAEDAGLVRHGGEDQLTDELIGQVIEAVRPERPSGRGQAWERCADNRERIQGWLNKKVPLTKVEELLTRRGVVVPYRTLHRYAVQELGYRRQPPTVRIDDCAPGQELQVDFGRLGMIYDLTAARQRLLRALVFTAVFSRHMFVWVTFREVLEEVIAGFEAAWEFFGGVFAVVVPDNLKAIVDRADATSPRLNATFLEYAQARGFVVDPTRVRRPQDKPRVERAVPYVRGSFFAGEAFRGREEAQRRAEVWCLTTAGMRIHGTIHARPVEVFRVQEATALGPAPTEPFDTPTWTKAKVHRDHHIQVDKALYSVPGDLIGQRVDVRFDSRLVKIFLRGQLVKIHPHQHPGGRSTDAEDLPPEKTAYAMRDLDQLVARAHRHGDSVGAYAAALLEVPLPWTRMRAVYRLLGLVNKFGASPVDEACRRALECEAIDIGLVSRMVERAADTAPAPQPKGVVVAGRFARDPDEFAVSRNGQQTGR